MSPVVIVCANCGGQLMVPPEVFGKLVKCPLCKHVFPAPTSPDAPARQAPRGPRAADPPNFPPRRDDSVPSLRKPPYQDNDDAPRRRLTRYDDEEERIPPRARYVRFDDDDEDDTWVGRRGTSDLAVAETAVAGPAICMMVYGGLIVFAGVLVFLSSLGRFVPSSQRAEKLMFAVVCFGLGGVIILGGVMMKNLRSYGLAMLGCLLLFIMHPCLTIHIALGIWALVVMNKQEVKRAFRWKANQ